MGENHRPVMGGTRKMTTNTGMNVFDEAIIFYLGSAALADENGLHDFASALRDHVANVRKMKALVLSGAAA